MHDGGVNNPTLGESCFAMIGRANIEGVCGRVCVWQGEHAWQRGMCGRGGMHGGGRAWQGGMHGTVNERAHHTGMHSCTGILSSCSGLRYSEKS